MHREDGSSLIMVIGVTAVLTIVITALMTSSLSGLRSAVRDESRHAALQAAEAGVDDYLYRLNQDGNYWRFSASNPPPDGNDAFTAEVAVPGASNPASFEYEPDISDLPSQGTIRLTSTGTVRDASRSIEVVLRRRSFLDYLYFTDYETKDPAAYSSGRRDWAQANCVKYDWQGGGRHRDCDEIVFYGSPSFVDAVNGPLHTNDTLRIFGNPAFNGPTTSSHPLPSDDGEPDCPPERYIDAGGAAPQFARGCDPAYQSMLQMPPDNRALRSEADHTLGKDGCLFTGPTKIELLDNGQMKVWSPFTKDGNCLAVDGQAQPLPDNGVIYVQSVPSDATDPNHTSGCPVSNGHPFWSDLSNATATRDDYGCRDGDVFLWGTLDGQLTVAAENDINIVWHLEYEDHDTDVLGLVADNYVQLYHPLDDCGRNCVRNDAPRFHHRWNNSRFTDPRIEAAILSVRHSFRVSRYDHGDPLGDLQVFGAIAQRFRGPVGTFNPSSGRPSTGYAKSYVYDDRLRYLSPPHFLDPVESAWQVATWSE